MLIRHSLESAEGEGATPLARGWVVSLNAQSWTSKSPRFQKQDELESAITLTALRRPRVSTAQRFLGTLLVLFAAPSFDLGASMKRLWELVLLEACIARASFE